MAPSKEELLDESGFGSSSSYGDYNTYGAENYDATLKKANPFATGAGYAYSPSPLKPSPEIKRSQLSLLGSALSFVLAIGIGFYSNVRTAQEVAHFKPGAAISAGICSILVALLLYATVAYLMHQRQNTGRMIGIGFSLVGIIMGLVSIVVAVLSGSALGFAAAVFYALVIIFNLVWLKQTNNPALYRALRM